MVELLSHRNVLYEIFGTILEKMLKGEEYENTCQTGFYFEIVTEYHRFYLEIVETKQGLRR